MWKKEEKKINLPYASKQLKMDHKPKYQFSNYKTFRKHKKVISVLKTENA